jgi:hypothetical protein
LQAPVRFHDFINDTIPAANKPNFVMPVIGHIYQAGNPFTPFATGLETV